MPRLFDRISEDALAGKINRAEDALEGDYGYSPLLTLTKWVEEDLKKVKFDAENFFTSSYSYTEENKVPMGYQTLDNGMSFLGCFAGGDWEDPVFFIVYWDGKKLRGYIPKNGNAYNHTAKIALGNGAEKDYAFLKKVLKGKCEIPPKPTKEEDKFGNDLFGIVDDLRQNFKPDGEAMIADIKERIQERVSA